MKILLNAVLYQAIWFLAVLGGNVGALAGVLLLLVHFSLSTVRQADLKMVALLFGTGLGIDGVLHYFGFMTFTVTGFPIPFWLLMIWLGLAITPHHCLAWMKGKYLLSALFGALGGPAAYWAGVRLGAADFSWPLPYSLLTLAVIWAVLWPAVMYFSVISAGGPSAKSHKQEM